MAQTTDNQPEAAQLRERNRELAILNEIAQAMNREVDLAQAVHTALRLVAELLHLRTGWLWLMREDSNEDAYLAATQELPPGLANDAAMMSGDLSCYCLDSYKVGDLEGAANVNIIKCTRLNGLANSKRGNAGLRYHASIPLYAHGKKLGVLNLASRDWRELSPEDLQLLRTVGDLLSIAIERARLFNQSAQIGAVEERNRIAREIHDTLAQGLAAITLQLETADALIEAGVSAERTRSVVQQALNLTRANLEETRRSVLDLRAAPLEGRRLAEALQALGEAARKPDLQVVFVGSNVGQPLTPRLEVGLYRIAQEALANAVQHAHACHVQLRLTISATEAKLEVDDDGVGFEMSQAKPNRFGLIGMNERARLLGGKLTVRSSPVAGTCIEAIVPLEGR